MNIAFEMVGSHSGGGLTVAKSILGAMQKDPDIDRIDLFCDPTSKWSEPFEITDKIQLCERPKASSNYVARFHWLTKGFREALVGRKIDRVFACNANCISDRPTTAYLHQPLLFEPSVRKQLPHALKVRLPVINALTRTACRRAKHTIVQTDWMASAVIKSYDLAPEGVVTIPGIVPCATIATENNPGDRRHRFLFVGNMQKYKQFDFAQSAIQRARDSRTTLLATLAPTTGYNDRTLRLGVVPRYELLGLMQTCTALIFPSLIESFGFPLAEAMANGLPVFAIDRPYARDVCGDAAFYFDTERELTALIDRANVDVAFCDELRNVGLKRAKAQNERYSWQSVVDVVKR